MSYGGVQANPPLAAPTHDFDVSQRSIWEQPLWLEVFILISYSRATKLFDFCDPNIAIIIKAVPKEAYHALYPPPHRPTHTHTLNLSWREEHNCKSQKVYPRREVGVVWYLPSVCNLRTVVSFHCSISSPVLLPSPVTLSILSFSACWPILWLLFSETYSIFFVKRKFFFFFFFVWLLCRS